MKKVISMLILSVVFGISQSIIEFNSDFDQMIGSTFIPIIFTVIFSTLYMVLQKLLKFKYFSFIEISWKIFTPFISILYFTLIFSYFNKENTKSQSTSNENYKKTVQDNNSESEKEIGGVKTEFLNKDHLYENYLYNYSIKLPENFKVNYGIGKHSEISAYHPDSGYMVSVNVGDFARPNINSNLSQDQETEKLINGAYSVVTSADEIKNLEETFEKRGFADVKFVNSKMTNYNNRSFIFLKFEANQIIDNKKYPTIIIDHVTIYKSNIYHFAFRAWTNLFNEKWEDEIRQTMSSVLISEYITNNNE
jgi:hypothetical protein